MPDDGWVSDAWGNNCSYMNRVCRLGCPSNVSPSALIDRRCFIPSVFHRCRLPCSHIPPYKARMPISWHYNARALPTSWRCLLELRVVHLCHEGIPSFYLGELHYIHSEKTTGLLSTGRVVWDHGPYVGRWFVRGLGRSDSDYPSSVSPCRFPLRESGSCNSFLTVALWIGTTFWREVADLYIGVSTWYFPWSRTKRVLGFGPCTFLWMVLWGMP